MSGATAVLWDHGRRSGFSARVPSTVIECGKAGLGQQGAKGLPSSAGSRGPQTIAPGPSSPLASTLQAWVCYLPPSLLTVP